MPSTYCQSRDKMRSTGAYGPIARPRKRLQNPYSATILNTTWQERRQIRHMPPANSVAEKPSEPLVLVSKSSPYSTDSGYSSACLSVEYDPSTIATPVSLSIAELMMRDDVAASLQGVQLISEDASTIIVDSDEGCMFGAFVAWVAAEEIWDMVHASVTKVTRSRSTSPSLHTYGIIGGERATSRTVDLMDDDMSDNSSTPSAATPREAHTPSPSSAIECGIPEQYLNTKFRQDKLPWSDHFYEQPLEERADGRPPAFTAFSWFVQSVMQGGRFNCQAILLAWYYIAVICKHSPEAIYGASSLRSAPYRIFIGALMTANKMLDDHSYVSATWAKLTGVPVKDIVAAQYFILDALSYDTLPSLPQWRCWLREVDPHFGPSQSISGLLSDPSLELF